MYVWEKRLSLGMWFDNAFLTEEGSLPNEFLPSRELIRAYIFYLGRHILSPSISPLFRCAYVRDDADLRELRIDETKKWSETDIYMYETATPGISKIGISHNHLTRKRSAEAEGRGYLYEKYMAHYRIEYRLYAYLLEAYLLGYITKYVSPSTRDDLFSRELSNYSTEAFLRHVGSAACKLRRWGIYRFAQNITAIKKFEDAIGDLKQDFVWVSNDSLHRLSPLNNVSPEGKRFIDWLAFQRWYDEIRESEQLYFCGTPPKRDQIFHLRGISEDDLMEPFHPA